MFLKAQTFKRHQSCGRNVFTLPNKILDKNKHTSTMMSTLEFRPLDAVGFRGGDILELHPLSICMRDFRLSSMGPSTVAPLFH